MNDGTRLTTGRGLVDSTASFLGVNLRRADRVSISVYGSLFLAGAVAAARLGDRSIAQTYLARAEAAADEMPGDDNALWTSFGPTNVAIHRVTAMMEFGDAQPALDLGAVLDISSLPVERRVRHTLEIARARCLKNQRDEALSTLLSAEQMAPQQVRVHFLARQIARTLVRGSRRRPSGELSALATRLQALS